MIEIINDCLAVKIALIGAEVQSVFDLTKPYEYLWQGTPPHWNRRAPVLFPIVGSLKEKRYQFKGNIYKMEQHGFARNLTFEIVTIKENAVSFEQTACN